MIDIECWVEKSSRNSKGRGNNSVDTMGQSNADEAKRAKYADYAEEAGHTKVAEYAKVADKAKEVDEISLSSKTLTRFLRNDVADTAKEVITFLKGIVAKAVSYFEGIVNRGNINNTGDIHNTGNINNTGNIHNTGNINNTGNITTNNLTVTGKATFFELEILKAKAAGGIIIQSAATFKVDDFKDTAEGYVCYQLAEKDGKVLRQMCDKFDLMLCHGGLNVGVGVSHNVSNHYYWRMVTDAPEAPVERGGKKYLKIVLSKTDFATGSDKPQVGDEMAQVGNRVDKERQCVMMSCAYKGLDTELKPPYWAHYMGVNNYDISTHRYTWFAANGSQVTGNFKVRSDNGGLELVEDYMKNLVQENYTRPNLLWGSDLNLDGVDATSKAAIQKHLGVGLNAAKVDNTEWFEYLKGGGIGGSDAIKAKVAVANGEGNYYAGLYWQVGFGAKHNIKVKPNTKYTFSFWIRTEILQGRGYAVAESFNMESLTGGRKDRTMPWTDVKATNEWERKSYTFTTGTTGYIMVGVGLSGEDNFSGLIYLCHPKLEEGDTATPWCAYGDMTGHSLVANAFMEGTYRNGCTKGVKSYVRVFYDGQEVKDFTASYRYKGGGFSNWSEPESKSSDGWDDTQRDGSTIFVEYVVEYKGLKALATGRLDNIQDGKDGESVEYCKLIPVEEKAVAYFTGDKKKRVDVSLKYKVKLSLGDTVYFIENLYGSVQLRGDSNLVEMGGFKTKSDTYGSVFYIQKTGMEYKECPNNSYVVTLIRKDKIIDRRIVPIVFKANVIFDINTRLGTVTSNVENVKGDFSKIEQKVDSISSTVGNVKGDFSKIEQKVDSVSVKVGGLERGLHDTGIDIARREITATADNFKIRNNNGKETFFVDKDGKITAPLANIGDWKIEDGKIVSKLKSRYYNDNEHGNIIELDANEGCIRATTKNGADSKAATAQSGEVELNFDSAYGVISARNKANGRYSSISPSGVFVNTADMLCRPLSSGKHPVAGVVSLGHGRIDKQPYLNYDNTTGEEWNFLAGMYGSAMNKGNAPSYGGYFYKLKVCGLYKRTRVLFPNENRVSLDNGDTLLILFTQDYRDIYINLPKDPYIGQTIEMINTGGGYGYIYTQDNTKIWWGKPLSLIHI